MKRIAMRLSLWFWLGAAACSTETTILVEVEAAPGVKVATLTLDVSAAETDAALSRSLPLPDGSFALPNQILLRMPDVSWDVTVSVAASDSSGQPLAASAQVKTIPHAQVSARLVLGLIGDGGTDSGPRDLATLATGPPNWISVAPLLTARAGLSATADADGGIYAIGGYVSDGGGQIVVGTTEYYLADSDSWTQLPSMPTPRAFFGAATLGDGRVVTAGGTTSIATPNEVKTTEAYSSATGWAPLMDLPAPRAYLAAALASDGNLYAIGGFSAGAWRDDVTALNLAGAWIVPSKLPEGRGHLSAAIGSDGRLYAIGGEFQNGFLRSVVAYTLGGTWVDVAQLPQNRDVPASTLAPDGRIFTVGGDPSSLQHPYAYMASTNTWQDVANLKHPRTALGLAVGSTGRLYAIGGTTGGPALNNVEAYGPILSLSSPSGAVGTTVQLSGSNFAASAAVSVYWSNSAPLAGSGSTDLAGTLIAPISLTVPSVAGRYRVKAVDSRSQYPVSIGFKAQ